MSGITLEELAETAYKADRHLEKEMEKLAVRVLALEVMMQQLATAILSATDSIKEFDEETNDHTKD